MTHLLSTRRPRPEDDENDILRMQDEFLESNIEPSAHIIYPDRQYNSEKCQGRHNITSKFSANKKLKSNEESDTNPAAKSSNEDIKSNIILGDIVERKQVEEFEFQLLENSNYIQSGFPLTFTPKLTNTKKSGSLFIQSFSNKTKNIVKQDEFPGVQFKDYGLITEKDILEAKKMIESKLDPSLIEFIKQRKKQKDLSKKNKNTDDSSEKQNQSDSGMINFSQNQTSSTDELPEILQEIATEAEKSHWIHMDVVETKKAKWMESLPLSDEPRINPEEPYNARFDFNGVLLPFNDERITVNQGLHHHGEEPERPGYSLQELLQLSRSSSPQQRSIALQTLAHVIEKSRRGWYDSILQPAPLIALSEKNLFLLLRFSIDDSSVSIVSAALQAMRAFLYNEEDQVCLDRLFGLHDDFKEPILKPDLKDVKDISDLKDHELAQLDIIATAFRSDIIARIKYILNVMKVPPEGVYSALEILISMAKHSQEMSLNIVWDSQLLDIITKYFIPLTTDQLINQSRINNAYGVPVISALRLCRVLITYAGKPATEKLFRLEILKRIVSYVSSEAGMNEIQLHIECFRLWKLFIINGFGIESVSGSELILRTQLKIFLDKLNFGEASELFCEHAASLILVASHQNSLRADILQLLKKWSIQLANITGVTWGSSKLLCHTLSAADDCSEAFFMSNWTLNSKIFTKLNYCSNLTSGLESTNERSPSSLPSLGALTKDGKVQPILSQESCFPLLAQALKTFSRQSRIMEIENILGQAEFIKYINNLTKLDWSLVNSWYTRIEFDLLTTIISVCKLIEKNLSSIMKNALWLIALRLISSLPADCPNKVKELLNYVLDPEKISMMELLKSMKDLKLNDSLSERRFNVLSMELIRIYESYIPFKNNWQEPSMPKDWLFLPLIDTYKNAKQYQRVDKSDMEKIMIILNLYLNVPQLLNDLSLNLIFSRLILLFLCETIFNDENLYPLIEKVISDILRKNYKKLNLDEDVPGLSSFTDMFTALCENFTSNSYGNNCFSNVLLTFISQRQNVHYRKMLWSEHAGVLRYIKVSVNEMILPIDELLYPVEKDISLIECYITALIRGHLKKEWSPVPYLIALHHSAMFVKEMSKLASRMRSGLERMRDSEMAKAILNYDPSLSS